MAVTLGNPPLADFDQPLRLLRDCHRRIEHFLGVLRLVVERSPQGELDDERRRALEIAIKYFREARGGTPPTRRSRFSLGCDAVRTPLSASPCVTWIVWKPTTVAWTPSSSEFTNSVTAGSKRAALNRRIRRRWDAC